MRTNLLVSLRCVVSCNVTKFIHENNDEMIDDQIENTVTTLNIKQKHINDEKYNRQ